MPSKKAVKSEISVSPVSDLAPAKIVRKRSTASLSKTASASAEKKPTTGIIATKKAAVAVDTTVAAVTHRHKKQEMIGRQADAPAAFAAYQPSHEEVAKVAYSYYVARGYQPGDQAHDWFRAVQELKQRHAASLLSDSQA